MNKVANVGDLLCASVGFHVQWCDFNGLFLWGDGGDVDLDL